MFHRDIRQYVSRTVFAMAVCALWAMPVHSLHAAEAPDSTGSKLRHDDLVSPADAPVADRRITYSGDIWMTISNDGSIGTESDGLNAVSAPGLADERKLKITYDPSFEFPAGTKIDYLFKGSVWIGGIVGADTLVSSTVRSGSSTVPELNGFSLIQEGVPPEYPGICDTTTRQLKQSYTCYYSDTMILPTSADVSGRLHKPMGLSIRQVTHQSPDNFTRRFVIYDLAVTNISDHPIDKMWFGVFLDNDIFWQDISGCGGSYTSDDLSGVMPTWPDPINPLYLDTLMVAWAIDNDGDPCGRSTFPRLSARGAMGIRILQKPDPNATINFNWFTTNFQNIDWGPRLQTAFRDLGGTGGNGRPNGDANEYYMMSDGEVDYPQYYAATDMTALGWKRSLGGTIAEDIANGLDSRILLSCGPLARLNPGETVPFTFALVAGGNVHVDPLNTINPHDPQPYVDKLDFSDLATNAWWAGFVWDNYGFDTNKDKYSGKHFEPVIGDTVWYEGDGCPDLAGPAPPPNVDSATGDLSVSSRPYEFTVHWTGRTVETSLDPLLRIPDFEGYRVYVAQRASTADIPGSAEYALVAQWDKVDYRRYTYNPGNGLWLLDSQPFTAEEWRTIFGDPNFDPLQYALPSIANCYKYTAPNDQGEPVEHCAYFTPQSFNLGNKYVDNGDTVENLIQRVGDSTSLVDGQLVHYGIYEARFTDNSISGGQLPSKAYFVSVTSFDMGDPSSSLEPLETAVGGVENTLAAIPIFSADVVDSNFARGGAKRDSVRVTVFPNPYKIEFDGPDGGKTSYFAQGYEGVVGQSQLQERDRRIHFINLPEDATIRIYTLDGDLVRTLNHPDPNLSTYSSEISWDLISRNTQAVTSGIYLYRVDSKLGSQVGKIVIIK